MTHLFGWWDVEPETRSLVNRRTSQRVSFVGIVDSDRASSSDDDSKQWMRFDYDDPDISYPLIVEWCEIPSTDRPGKRAVVWHLDHIRSASLWRNESNAAESHPPYGIWSRVDDAMSDVLAIWPTIDGMPVPPSSFAAISGGWLNGGWTTDFYRRLDRVGKATLSNYREPGFVSSLASIEAAAPRPWEFVPQTDERSNASLCDWGFVRMPDGGLHLPTGVVPRGMEESRAYLRTEDRRKFLIPHLTSFRGPPHNPKPFSRLIYVDDDIVTDAISFSVTKEPASGCRTLHVGYSAYPGSLGDGHCGVIARRGELPDAFVMASFSLVGAEDVRFWQPSPDLWRRFAEAVRCAWPNWGDDEFALVDGNSHPLERHRFSRAELILTNGALMDDREIGSACTRVISATSLEPCAPEKPHPLKQLFGDGAR